MPITVRFDPTSTSPQAQIIPNVSLKNDGVLSAAQYAALLEGGSADTVAQIYANGTTPADQTASISPANGGGLTLRSAVAAVGSLFRALTSVSAELFNVIDAAIPKVNLAGTFVQNDPVFGSPVMGSQTPGGFMSYTGDGIGPDFGGTGLTAQNNGVASIARLTVNDVSELDIIPNGIAPNNYGLPVAQPQAIVANTISPTEGLITLGAGVLKTITPIPNLVSVFQAYMLFIIPTAAFKWDATDNIAQPGTAVPDQLLIMVFNSGVWYPSYT
jgi:hypothetical protein